MQIRLVPLSETHLEAVLAIEDSSFPRPWTANHFQEEMDSSFSSPLVALAPDGSVAGYICPKLVVDEGEILDVAVHPSFRGQGVGRLLVRQALDWCRLGGAQSVYLDVRVSNKEAIALYSGLGFRTVGRRKRYYENGEDAELMEYSLTAS